MNRNNPVFPFLFFVAICIVLLFSLSSCDTGSKGQYKFQPESLHWLQFRGPNGTGIAPENANPPIHFNADTNLLWKTEILPGWSSPCIVNDRIFLTGYNDSDSLLYTLAINRENGDILWKNFVRPDEYYSLHPINTYADPSVASDGKNIFSSFPNYGLIAYDLDGNKLWDFRHETITHSMRGSISPLVLDSLVIQHICFPGDPRIVAVSCQTGEPVWTIRAGEHRWASMVSRATPVIYDNLLILHLKDEIVAYNLVDQSVEWWIFTPTAAIGTPVIKRNVLFVNTWTMGGEESNRGKLISFTELLKECDKDANRLIAQTEFREDMMLFERPEIPDAPGGSMYFKDDVFFAYFDANKDQAMDESEWNTMLGVVEPYMEDHGMLALPVEGSGERSFTEIQWKISEDTPETPSPLMVNENVIFIKNGGIMTVINQETGEIVHKDRIGAAGSYLSSPMLGGNRIYLCSYNGTVTVLSADDFSVLEQNKLREKIGASPVAVDDVLYVRTDKHLYAFRGK